MAPTSDARRFRFVSLFALAALVAGVAMVAHGLARLQFPAAFPWTDEGLVRFPALLAGLLIAILVVARLFRLGAVGATTITTASLLALLGAALPLVIVAAFGLASTLVGFRLRRLWHDGAGSVEDPLIDLLVGAGAYGTLISVLAHVPLNHQAFYALLLALPIALDRHAALAWLRVMARALRDESRSPAAAWVAGTLAAMYAVVALLPEVGPDALAMHLFIPSHLAIHRSWNFDVTRYAFAVMPTLVDWIYGISYVLEGERATRLVNAGFVAIGAALVFRLAALAGATRVWSWFAAALFLATPITFMIGSSLFVDMAWTTFVLGGVLMLARPAIAGQPPYGWVTAAALAGFAAAAKAVTLPMLPALLLLVAAGHRALRARGAGRMLLVAVAVFVLAGCKPYLTAWLMTGNPVYPFFVNIFGGPAFDVWRTGPLHFSAPLSWTTPYDVTFDSRRFVEGRAGSAGFQWLLLLPAALVAFVVARHRRGLMLVVVGTAIAVLVFYFMAYLRYVVPALALIIAAIAVGGTALKDASPWSARAFAVAGAAVLALNLAFLNAAGFYAGFPLDTVASAARRRAFLEYESPMRSATELAWRLPATGGRLAFFGTPTFAAAPGVEALHPSWYTPRFLHAVQRASTPDEFARALLDWNVRYTIVQAGTGDAKMRRLLDQATRSVIDFPGVSVRELHPDVLFRYELLQNPELGAPAGWALFGKASYDAAGRLLRVSVDSPAFQVVPVKPGAVFRNAVRARCESGGEARVQINWLDQSQALLGFALQPFACQPAWTTREQEVVAPPKAALAVVFATSASATPVEVGGVSFRGAAPR